MPDPSGSAIVTVALDQVVLAALDQVVLAALDQVSLALDLVALGMKSSFLVSCKQRRKTAFLVDRCDIYQGLNTLSGLSISIRSGRTSTQEGEEQRGGVRVGLVASPEGEELRGGVRVGLVAAQEGEDCEEEAASAS